MKRIAHRPLALLLALTLALTLAPTAFAADKTPPAVDLLHLINSENPILDGYVPELVQLENGHAVDERCYAPLTQMLADCRAAGLSPFITSSYRTQETQRAIFDERVAAWQNAGYTLADAQAITRRSVAVPGTSEHQLGLAVDIVDAVDSANLNPDTLHPGANAQQWLIQNCWEYGFIMRYPGDKTEITGAVFEPWHFRYVGVEPALAMRDGWLCLEEYLQAETIKEASI